MGLAILAAIAAMNIYDRLNCQVRLADAGGGLHGCGFICGPRHVLTCSHVVRDCLGTIALGATVGAQFGADRSYRATLAVAAFYPVEAAPGAGAEADRRRDLCLLELAPGSGLPKDAVAVRPSAQPLDSGIAYEAIGLEAWDTGGELKVDNANLAGVTGNLSDASRLFLRTPSGGRDDAVRPGCSGTAAFARDGVIGMIAEEQGTTTGLMIPLDVLREIWNFAAAAPAAGAGQAAVAAEPLNRRLYDAFAGFDREQQVAQFSRIFAARWGRERRGFLCAIAGLADDLPTHCRDRIRARLSPLFEAEGYSARKILVNELEWPDERRFDVEGKVQELSWMLADHLDVADDSVEGLRAGLNAARAPCIFYSEIDQRVWSARHLELLTRWAATIDALSREALARPLIHFLLFRLDETRLETNGAEPERRLETYYRDLAGDVNRAATARPRLECTDRLAGFRRSFVEEWLDKVGLRLDLDEAALACARDGIWRDLPAQESFRLERVERWIRQLA